MEDPETRGVTAHGIAYIILCNQCRKSTAITKPIGCGKMSAHAVSSSPDCAEDLSRSTIAVCAKECRDSLHESFGLLNAYRDGGLGWSKLRDLLGRFNIWTSSMGVFAALHASLDYRLRDLADVKELILEHLRNMMSRADQLIRLLIDIEKASTTDAEDVNCRPQAKPDGHKEVDTILSSLSTSIDWLHRLANMIRRASTSRQNEKASTFPLKDEGGADATPELKKLFHHWIKRDFPTISDDFCERLISTMLLRRRRILYRRSRQSKLALRTAESVRKPTLLTAPSASPGLEEEDAKPGQTVEAQAIAISAPSGVASTQHTATTIEPQTYLRVRSTPSKVSGARTIAMTSGVEEMIPPPPSVADNALEFICPFCSLILPAKAARNRGRNDEWAVHVKKDLDPYVCHFFPCCREEDMFSTSADWISHMQQTHCMRWHCMTKTHRPESFASMEDYIAHMTTKHPGKFKETQLPFLAANAQRPLKTIFRECPLCGEENVKKGESFENHVAHHLQYLALLSLPPPEDVYDAASVASIPSTASHVQEGDERVGASRTTRKSDWHLMAPATFPEGDEYLWGTARPADDEIPDIKEQGQTIMSQTWQMIRASKLGLPNMNQPVTKEEQLCDKTLARFILHFESRQTTSDNADSTLIQPDRYQVVHRTGSGDGQRLYLDQPQYLQGEDTYQKVIAGKLPVSNLASYLSKHVEICFFVFRDYDETATNDSNSIEDHRGNEPCPENTAESVRLVRKSLTDTYNRFLAFSGFNTEEEAKDSSITLEAPYYAFYNKQRRELAPFVATLAQEHQSEFLLLVNYILAHYSQEWDEVDSLMARGRITPKYIKYLFKPGELVVQETEQGIRGYLATSSLEGPQFVEETWMPQPRKDGINSSRMEKRREYNIHASSWEFDGTFSYVQKRLAFQLESEVYDDAELNIANLEIRPLAHTAWEVRDRLRSRGFMFWKCRWRHFVFYHEDPRQTMHHSGDGRYMIDTRMYQELLQAGLTLGSDDLGLELMEHDEPPSDNDFPGFIYMMPTTIKGFNLKSKKWLDLKVDNIGEVAWNDELFQSLVLQDDTKSLIHAMIKHRIEAENRVEPEDRVEPEEFTDLIRGNAKGLIILLHGGPGSGKTLTAESVAEIARKPLYSVNCGDIGTEADQVEKYLESVLYIGRTWGCVVLMDEADVFLQERNLKDLQRNALVSVFLRVLEYYDGILVLTSNRVGRLDEAFKSRIHLSIHYPALDENQRTKIWQSFIHRLQTSNEDNIDIPDLEYHIPQLAKNKMNGREIRNTITTARQFAKWKRQDPGGQHRQLDYAMLKEIIEVSNQFKEYLENISGLNDGNSPE